MSLDELAEVYQSSKTLMNEAIAQHQAAVDCLHALRFIMHSSPEPNNPLSDGIEMLLAHQENLRRLALSYHQAVGEAVQKENSLNGTKQASNH